MFTNYVSLSCDCESFCLLFIFVDCFLYLQTAQWFLNLEITDVKFACSLFLYHFCSGVLYGALFSLLVISACPDCCARGKDVPPDVQ